MAVCAELYISPTGSDAAAGTSAAPLATLAAARDKADQLKTNNTQVTVYLRGGTYYLNAPVAFGPGNSGSATAPIVYKAYQNEKPVLSGGIKVTSAWTTSSGSIMKTTIAQNLKVDQLFLNGNRQVLARYPNFNAATKILDGYASDCMTRVSRWANPLEGPGYLRALHSQSWGGWDEIFTGKNGTTITTQWVGDHGRTDYPGPNATYRLVENIFEELDAAGEWFYRKSTGELFFWPPAGTNLSTATIELASQDEVLRFVGASMANVVKYVQFDGMTFTHTYRTLFSKTYGVDTFEMVTMSDWAITRAGTVFMQNAENIRIANCFFDQIGGNGVFISGYNKNHVIFNNVFIDAGASCVAIMGPLSAIRCGRTRQGSNPVPCNNDRTPGPLTTEYPSYITIDNNIMNHFGRFEKQPAGVALSATEFDTIRHNTIHDCPRAGICFCDGCWGGHVVEYNWVYNSVQETGDHGPFNAWGRDRNDSRSSDLSAAKLDCRNTTIVRNNRFEGPSGDFGIDLDDGSSNYLQYNNLIIGGGLKFQFGRYNRAFNNIIVKGGTVQFHGTLATSSDSATRNIFVGSYLYGTCCFAGGTNIPAYLKTNMPLYDSNVVDFVGSAAIITSWGGTGALYNWSQWTGAGMDAHSATADPQFTDPNKTWPGYSPVGDYSVKAGSPALALGFKNFPMDSFGVMPAAATAAQSRPGRALNASGIACGVVRYEAGRLIVETQGEYQATVTNSLGRTLRVFRGKDRSTFNLGTKPLGGGIYFVNIRGTTGEAIKRFIVN